MTEVRGFRLMIQLYRRPLPPTGFGRTNFVGTITGELATRENRKVLSRNHEYLLAYADIEVGLAAQPFRSRMT
jgi:hypothetical protein